MARIRAWNRPLALEAARLDRVVTGISVLAIPITDGLEPSTPLVMDVRRGPLMRVFA
jgi:hypothetical protein